MTTTEIKTKKLNSPKNPKPLCHNSSIIIKGATMALTTCKECGENVSTKANICPHCGVEDPSTGF